MNCEIKGVVGNNKKGEKPCIRFATKLVSVEELSPLKCCSQHTSDMQKFWGAGGYTVSVKPYKNDQTSI